MAAGDRKRYIGIIVLKAGIPTMLLHVSTKPLQGIEWIWAYAKMDEYVKLITVADEILMTSLFII